MDSPYKHNKPTAPPPPGLITNSKSNDTQNQPPDYASAMAKSTTVVHSLIENTVGGASANTVVTKTVSDHDSNDGWEKIKNDNDDSDTEGDKPEKKVKKPNTIVNQEQNDKFVKITMKIPGLKVKYITHNPKNGRVLSQEYNRNKVKCTFVLNEDRADRKQVYQYESREPLKMNIKEEGSYFKFADDTVKWRIKKA